MSSPWRIGRYEILSELGRGAMGVVFKARDPHIGRLVAVKTITANVAEDPELMERFYQEAKTAGALQHSNVVTIYEMAEADGAPFIAMEYLEGQNLNQLIASGAPLSIAQRLGFIVQACHALDYAHRMGIIHRDIKPGNIMLTRGGLIKVVDFGLARLADASKTQTGTVLGTFAYMSPQQFYGRHADARSDIWAVGVVLYELVSYQKAFSGDSHASLIMSILQDNPTPLRKLSAECPEQVERIVQKALRKDDADRYQTVEELLLDLEPVWTSERDKTAERFIQNARNMMVKRRLTEARDSVDQCLLVDRSNVTAKNLLEEINMLLGVTALPDRIREHVVKGQGLLKEGLFAEARDQAEFALGLDPRDTSARNLLESVEAEQARARQEETNQKEYIDHQTRAVRASIERGDLSSAIELGKSALSRVGANLELSQLVRLAERERLVREGNSSAEHEVEGSTTERRASPELAVSSFLESETSPPSFEREYAFQSASLSPVEKTRLIRDGAATTTVRDPTARATLSASSEPTPSSLQIERGEKAGQLSIQGHTKVPSARVDARRRWKRVAIYATAGAIAMATAAIWTTFHFHSGRTPVTAVSPVNGAPTDVAPSQTESAQNQQQRLLDIARDSANSGDFDAAQSRLDEAEKLNGPLNPRIADLRDQFHREQQDRGASQIAREERPLWDEAIRKFNASEIDAAEQSFRKILELPAGGPRRSDAEHYLNEVIPTRRKEDNLWAKARELAQTQDPARLQESIGLLDNLAGSGGKHAGEAQRLREKAIQQLADAESAAQLSDSSRKRYADLEERFRQTKQQGDSASLSQMREIRDEFRALAAAGGPQASAAADYANNIIPATIKQFEDRQASVDAASRANAQFDDALNRYNQAVVAKDAATLTSQVLPAFLAVARSGGPKAPEALRYANSIIPEAIRNLTPWPAIGCPATPAGLEPSVKPGDLVACGLLDPPKLKWAQFSWPEFPSRARQAGAEKGVAMLTITVNENGNVTEALPRGPADAQGFADSALSAAKDWKTTAPRAQGKGVRTQFSVDVPFGP